MEEQLVQLLANTQLPSEGPRKQAELDLNHAKASPDFPLTLANIGFHIRAPTDIRQAALTYLRKFIEDNWTPGSSDGPHIPIPDAIKERLRSMMLELVLSTEDERKIKTVASYVVSKIAMVDFPEDWPTLLPTVLGVIPNGSDVQLHGALRILQDLVEESLSEEQFFTMARDIIRAVYDVALNENRKATHRGLAVLVFRNCFDLMDIVKEDHKKEVKAFADEVLKGWMPFLEQVLKMPLPDQALDMESQPDSWNGPIALKLQVAKTLIKIKTVFPALLLPQSTAFFSAIWEDLNKLHVPYERLFIESGAQGRLEDIDGLPFTLDFLVLEELDLLNQLLRAPPVQKELEAQINAHGAVQDTPWVLDLMKLITSYSRITQEEEGLWDIDVSLYLAEETSVSSNYTARTACGDLLIKVGEWLHNRAIEGLFSYTKSVFAEPDWRKKEASLYLFNMLASDFQDCQKPVTNEIASAYLELVNYAVNCGEEPILQARGYLVAGMLSQGFAPAASLLDRAIESITREPSELVQVACVKAIEGFISSKHAPQDRQVPIILAIQQFLEAKDLTELEDADDLLLTLLEALRAAINMDNSIAIRTDSKAIDLLFLIARHGANNFQVTIVVNEAFEDIASSLTDPSGYTALCAKVLPSLVGAFDVADMTQNDLLVTLATELLMILAQYGTEPLPAGFVASTLPKLTRLLMNSPEGEVLRPGAEAVKYMLLHDHQQVFEWHDENGRSGLEVCLHITDRLLGPSVEDNAASEVGGLAAELVEKAGHERLGPFLPQLLQAVATRLGTAEAAPFIQSLILVFARLSLVGAHDVVDFLSNLQIDGQSGLQVVLGKWLENSINFAGYDEIRQNVIALSKLYSLNDARLAQTMVRGDLIVDSSDRIVTRSMTKQNPHQYTTLPAPLKILKVLLEELLSASGVRTAAKVAAAAATDFADTEEDDGDDGWEDEPGETLDLSLGGTKADLMSYFERSGLRQRDDETQAYLTEFFIQAARENTAGFQDWYTLLTDEEKGKLNELAAQ